MVQLRNEQLSHQPKQAFAKISFLQLLLERIFALNIADHHYT